MMWFPVFLYFIFMNAISKHMTAAQAKLTTDSPLVYSLAMPESAHKLEWQ